MAIIESIEFIKLTKQSPKSNSPKQSQIQIENMRQMGTHMICMVSTICIEGLRKKKTTLRTGWVNNKYCMRHACLSWQGVILLTFLKKLTGHDGAMTGPGYTDLECGKLWALLHHLVIIVRPLIRPKFTELLSLISAWPGQYHGP